MGSLLVVITAAIAVGAAVVGPLFLRAGGDSLVRQAVAGATVSHTSFELDSATHSSTLDGLAAERAVVTPKRAPERAVRRPRGADDGGRPPRHQSQHPSALPRGADLPHRHLFESALQRRWVCNRSRGCGRQRSHGTQIWALRRVDAHRHRTSTTGVRPRSASPACLTSRTCRAPTGSATGRATFPSGRTPAGPCFSPRTDDLFVASPAAFALPSAYSAHAQHPERVAARSAGHRECVGGQAGDARPASSAPRRPVSRSRLVSQRCSRARCISGR